MLNSERGIEGGGGIAILGQTHNLTVSEQPDLKLQQLQGGGWELMNSSLTKMCTHWYSVSFFSFLIPKCESSRPWERKSNSDRKRLLWRNQNIIRFYIHLLTFECQIRLQTKATSHLNKLLTVAESRVHSLYK